MSREGIFKIIVSPPLINRIVENLIDKNLLKLDSDTPSKSFSDYLSSVDLIALSQGDVFLIHSKIHSGGANSGGAKKKLPPQPTSPTSQLSPSSQSSQHLQPLTSLPLSSRKSSDGKTSVMQCSLGEWVDLIKNRAKKILVDPNTPAEVILLFSSGAELNAGVEAGLDAELVDAGLDAGLKPGLEAKLKPESEAELEAKIKPKLVLSEPLLEEKELFHYFSTKTPTETAAEIAGATAAGAAAGAEKNKILEKQLELLQLSKKQIDTFCKTVLICEMAFVCNYHKLHQEALPSEMIFEMQHYINSKCNDLNFTKLNCKVEHYHLNQSNETNRSHGLNGSPKKLNDKEPFSDGQAIVLTISGKSHNIDLEKQRIVTYGLKIDEKFIATYNETLQDYLELKEILNQQFAKQKKSKNQKKENNQDNLSAMIEKIFKKENTKSGALLPYFRFSFSSDISLKYLPMMLNHILKQVKGQEILSIYFPVVSMAFLETMGHLSLHAVIELDEKSKRATMKILDRDNLNLLRFFS